jgi:hypothetical protein
MTLFNDALSTAELRHMMGLILIGERVRMGRKQSGPFLKIKTLSEYSP